MKSDLEIIYDRCLQARLSILKNDYNRTGSSLFIWEMISFCLSKKIEFPHVVNNYLSDASGKIISDTDIEDNATRYKDICDVFSLVGGHPFAKFLKEKEKRLFVVSYYCLLICYVHGNGIPAIKKDIEILKKNVRDEVRNGMNLSATDDRTLRNWINNFQISIDDILSHFVEDSNILNKNFPSIPAVVPLVIHDNPSLFLAIVENF